MKQGLFAALALALMGPLSACGFQPMYAGGETSGAVTKALGVSRLDIGVEIAPGVPWTFCDSDGHQIALALKSGNFGAETFFTDAQSVLQAQQS